ncbi:MAG TPA: ATPase inhibitor subunit zeta, partial [Caulobacteraceae bacterium]|nr:ATPase inhibitor subunit zeta [Caulobacteraceae bacterium]
EGQHLEDYAAAVARVGLAAPGDENVLRKVAKDLSGSGLKVSEDQVMGKMAELLAVAREELKTAG